MKNLFGETVAEKTPEEEYREYIASAAWKQKAKAAIARAGNKCERCGASHWTVTLTVHHLTYEHFKHEKPGDLRALCPKCHQEADVLRVKAEAAKNYQKYWNARLDAWATKVYGEHWRDMNTEAIDHHFRLWLEKVEEAR